MTQITFDLNAWLKAVADTTPNTYPKPRPPLICADGFTVSVQASAYHYCEPRTNDAPVYYSVELGYPSEETPLIMPWCEDADHPLNTVYGRVPVEVVEYVVRQHGGLAEVGTGVEVEPEQEDVCDTSHKASVYDKLIRGILQQIVDVDAQMNDALEATDINAFTPLAETQEALMIAARVLLEQTKGDK